MNVRTQGIAMTMFAAVCIRLALSDVYLRYVNAWMKTPLLITAGILLALAVRVVLRSDVSREDAVKAPQSAWFLLLPVLAVFVVSPPALGAYAAERNPVTVAAEDDGIALPHDANGVITMSVSEYASRAQWDDTLSGHKLALTGFVSKDKLGHWYVTRLAISCCAADAVAYRVQVAGAEEPARDTWIRVTGTWEKPKDTAIPRVKEPPRILAEEVEGTKAPRNPYE